MARQGEHGHEYAIKLFIKQEAFHEERRIYCDSTSGLGAHAASLMLPQVRTSYRIAFSVYSDHHFGFMSSNCLRKLNLTIQN